MSILKDRIDSLIEKYEQRIKEKEFHRDRYQAILDVTNAEIDQLKNIIFDLRFAIQGGTIWNRDKEDTVIEPAETEE